MDNFTYLLGDRDENDKPLQSFAAEPPHGVPDVRKVMEQAKRVMEQFQTDLAELSTSIKERNRQSSNLYPCTSWDPADMVTSVSI